MCLTADRRQSSLETARLWKLWKAHILLHQDTAPHPSKTVSPTGSHILKPLSLWTILIQTYMPGHSWNSDRRNWSGDLIVPNFVSEQIQHLWQVFLGVTPVLFLNALWLSASDHCSLVIQKASSGYRCGPDTHPTCGVETDLSHELGCGEGERKSSSEGTLMGQGDDLSRRVLCHCRTQTVLLREPCRIPS